MKKYFLISLFYLFFSCGGFITIRKISPVGKLRPLENKNIYKENIVINSDDYKEEKEVKQENNNLSSIKDPDRIKKLLKEAESYIGTPYLLGGTSRKGIDCSGFVASCFSVIEIKLPRTSQAQSTYGQRIKKNEIQKGDLLFFATGNNKNTVTHVGIVYDITKNDISFIHASTSKGVRIDNLSNSYWSPKFLFSNKIIN